MNKPKTPGHIVFDNNVLEIVIDIPTVTGQIDPVVIAKACFYSFVVCIDFYSSFAGALEAAYGRNGLSLIGMKSVVRTRDNQKCPKKTVPINKNTLRVINNHNDAVCILPVEMRFICLQSA